MNDRKIIIGLAGKIASGKDSVGKYFVEKYRAEKIRFSTILRNILEILNLPESRENMQSLSTVLRKNFGENILAKAIVKLTNKTNNNLVVIDGIRRLGDVDSLKTLNSFFLVYIDVDQDKRFKRSVARKENPGDENMLREKFDERDAVETEIQIESLKKEANFLIDNSGTLEETYLQIENIHKEINNRPPE